MNYQIKSSWCPHGVRKLKIFSTDFDQFHQNSFDKYNVEFIVGNVFIFIFLYKSMKLKRKIIEECNLLGEKRWALYVGFISFSQVALMSWRIYFGSILNIMLYETNKYSPGHQSHLGEAYKTNI